MKKADLFSQYSDQKGGAAFYTLFVLPITMILLMVVVDISRWQAIREEARREIDRIVLETAQYLPYRDDAITAYKSQANFFNLNNSASLNIDISDASIANTILPSKITATVSGSVESGFDSPLEAITGNNTSFPISETAQARLLPTDFVVIFSDSLNLRPPAPSLWGNSVDWQPSEYFSLIPAPTITINPTPSAPLAWPNWYSPTEFVVDKYMRFATQLCFNPVYSALKLGVLLAIDSISVNEENRLSIIASPGDVPMGVSGGPGYSVIQDIAYVNDPNASPLWSNYFEPDNAHCDEACVLYASSEIGNIRYVIPQSTTWQSQPKCAQTILDGIFTDVRGHYPNPFSSYLSSCFKNGGLSPREAVYYHGVRSNTHDSTAESISRALEYSLGKLVEVEKSNSLISSQKRKGLAKDTNKIVLVVSEVLPPINSPTMQRVLNFLQVVPNLKIYFVGYFSNELSSSLSQSLNIRKQEYKNSINGLEIELANPDSIQAVISSILVNERRVILSI